MRLRADGPSFDLGGLLREVEQTRWRGCSITASYGERAFYCHLATEADTLKPPREGIYAVEKWEFGEFDFEKWYRKAKEMDLGWQSRWKKITHGARAYYCDKNRTPQAFTLKPPSEGIYAEEEGDFLPP